MPFTNPVNPETGLVEGDLSWLPDDWKAGEYQETKNSLYDSKKEQLYNAPIVNDDGTINWEALEHQAGHMTHYTFGDWITGRYSRNLQANLQSLLNNAMSLYSDSTKAQRTAKDYAAAGINPLYAFMNGTPSSSYSSSSGSGDTGAPGLLRALIMFLTLAAKAAV